MRRAVIVCMISGLLIAGDRGGIRPRSTAADYPAHQTGKEVTIAAALVPPEQVAKLFATDLNRGGYVVVEVAMYPEAGAEVNLLSRDFLMRVGSDPATMRPVSAQAIAAALQRKNTPKPRKPSDVTLYPTATIGYESGSYGGQRRGGVYTATGVGVGIGDQGSAGPPRPASTDSDRTTMRQELEDKGLPEGRTSQAVAGYLYFPKPASSAKRTSYNLTYYGADGEVSLVIPQATKK